MIDFKIFPCSAINTRTMFLYPSKPALFHPAVLILSLSLRIFVAHGFSLSYLRRECEIRTREGATPTRFPSVRTKPLCELPVLISSVSSGVSAPCPRQSRQLLYHGGRDTQAARIPRSVP